MTNFENYRSSIINISFDDFIGLAQQIISDFSTVSGLNIKDFILRGNMEPSPNRKNPDWKDLIKSNMPIFDYFILIKYRDKFKENGNVEFILNDDVPTKFNESDYGKAILCAYYLMITRNKLIVEQDEKLPMFLVKFLNVSPEYNYKKYLTNNNINIIPKNWIRNIKFDNLGNSMLNRFKLGIAGSRFFNIFKLYPWIPRTDELETVCNIIKMIATDGPFWEQHPEFLPEVLRGISIAKNLQNLILEVYDDKDIKNMVKNRHLFKYPVKTLGSVEYKTWTSEFGSLFKNKLFK